MICFFLLTYATNPFGVKRKCPFPYGFGIGKWGVGNYDINHKKGQHYVFSLREMPILRQKR